MEVTSAPITPTAANSMNINIPKECRNCGQSSLYRSEVSAGGGYAPNYLPQLGSFWRAAKFTVVVCENCGETMFFAPPEFLHKLHSSSKWQQV
jgi:predicted nucleic-acid-binding Zn-ribbon protein